MINGLYSSISSQTALLRRLELIAGNIANMSTVGYRAETSKFDGLIAELSSGPVAFSTPQSTRLSTTQGSSVSTANTYDFMVQGDAWFAVDTPGGRAYTRDGRFKLSPEGQLVSLHGNLVLDSSGSPIQLEANGPGPVVSRDGVITQQGQIRGTIGLFQMSADARLERGPSSHILSPQSANAVSDFTTNGIVQGYLENSNVEPIKEVSNLMMTQKMFELVSSSIDIIDAARLESFKAIGPSG